MKLLAIIFVTISFNVGLFAQYKIYFTKSPHIIWDELQIINSDGTSKIITLDTDFTLNCKDKETFLSFKSINGLQSDTIVKFKRWKKSIDFHIEEISGINFHDTSCLIKDFIENKTSDTALYIQFLHSPPGCTSATYREEITLLKHSKNIYCLYRHHANSNIPNDERWREIKLIDEEFLNLLMELERRGMKSTEFCDSGFFGMDCGYYIILLGNRGKSFSNDLSSFNGIYYIREHFLKME
jgi:hypothetical protein